MATIAAVKKTFEAARPHPGRKLTYDEFLEWADGLHAEWVDGEVLVMSPPNRRHQLVSTFLLRLMSHYVELHKLGEVIPAPYQMRLRILERGREPDIQFISTEAVKRQKTTYLDGPADLAVEIISPDSALRDRGEKYAEYEAAGVREYWIIDHEAERADFFVLGADGRYDRLRPDEVGTFRSEVLGGFWINVAWLWANPLPDVIPITGLYTSAMNEGTHEESEQ